MCRKYKIPKSSLYYIIKSSNLNMDKKKRCLNIFENKYNLRDDEKNWLVKYIEPPQYPITVDSLNAKMSELFSEKNRY